MAGAGGNAFTGGHAGVGGNATSSLTRSKNVAALTLNATTNGGGGDGAGGTAGATVTVNATHALSPGAARKAGASAPE